MSEPADRTHTLYFDIGEVASETLVRCGICGALVIQKDREYHRRWHTNQPDEGSGYGVGAAFTGANSFLVVRADDGFWYARSSANDERVVGDTPTDALHWLIRKLTGWEFR